MKLGYYVFILLIINTFHNPLTPLTSGQVSDIYIKDVQLDFFDEDSDSYNDTVQISFFIDFTLSITANYTVDLSLRRSPYGSLSDQTTLTLNILDNISNYNTYTFTILEENTYYIALSCEYDTNHDNWESDNFHLDGYQQQIPRFAAVIYDYTNADGDAEGNPDGIQFTYNFASPFSGLTNIEINITFVNDQGVLIFSRVMSYSYEKTTSLETYIAGRAPTTGNYSARIDLYWNSWKRETFATPLHQLDRFYSFTNITSPSFEVKYNDGPNSIPISVYCQFVATTTENIELEFSAIIINAVTGRTWAYSSGSIFLQSTNVSPHSLYFEEQIYDHGTYYIQYTIQYMGFSFIYATSEQFELDGPDPDIDIAFQDITSFTIDTDGDEFGDAAGVSFNIYSSTPIRVIIETWIWSEGDSYHETSSYLLELDSGINEQQEVRFSSVLFESSYYVDLWVYYRSFPEAFEQIFDWYLYEPNHIETINISNKESSETSISLLKISFKFSPQIIVLIALFQKKYRSLRKTQNKQ